MRKSSEEFKPKIGRIKARDGGMASSHLNAVVRAINRAWAHRVGWGKSTTVARPRDFSRRVIVKARIVSLKGRSLGGVRAHLKYLVRDGVTRQGTEGRLYGRCERAGNSGSRTTHSASVKSLGKRRPLRANCLRMVSVHMYSSVDASQHRLNHITLISPNFFFGQALRLDKLVIGD